MSTAALVRRRLASQRLLAPTHHRPEDVVAWMGAVQAQEYGPARWALGLRLPTGVTGADVATAFDQGRLVRTHVLRPTWHFVAPADLRWLLALTAPRIRGAMASYDRRLGIDTDSRRLARRLIERTLAQRSDQTRAELGHALRAGGIEASGSRLAHLVLHAELDAAVCSGPRRGKQFTYALVDQRVPPVEPLSQEDAFSAIVLRYFRSHGPATLRDFTWWCGLPMTGARRVLESMRAQSCDVDEVRYWWIDAGWPGEAVSAEPLVHLLPIYDEYTVAYRDRVAVPHLVGGGTVNARRGRSGRLGQPLLPVRTTVTFNNVVVIDGQIAGTWRGVVTRSGITLELQLRRRLSPREREALAEAAQRHGRFVGLPVSLRRQRP